MKRSKASSNGSTKDFDAFLMRMMGWSDMSSVSQVVLVRTSLTSAIKAQDTTLAEYGIDSLMAVEIRQIFERELNVVLEMRDIRSVWHVFVTQRTGHF